MLTIAMVAETLNCSEGFVRKLIKAKKLGALVDGRFVRIPESSLEEYISAHEKRAVVVPPAPPAPPAPKPTCSPVRLPKGLHI